MFDCEVMSLVTKPPLHQSAAGSQCGSGKPNIVTAQFWPRLGWDSLASRPQVEYVSLASLVVVLGQNFLKFCVADKLSEREIGENGFKSLQCKSGATVSVTHSRLFSSHSPFPAEQPDCAFILSREEVAPASGVE